MNKFKVGDKVVSFDSYVYEVVGYGKPRYGNEPILLCRRAFKQWDGTAINGKKIIESYESYFRLAKDVITNRIENLQKMLNKL